MNSSSTDHITAESETPPPDSRIRLKNSLWAIAVLIALVVGTVQANRKKTSELTVYLKAANRMMSGEQIYRKDDPPAFSYPPFFALVFVPLAALPEVTHRTIWFLVNAGALAWILVLTDRMTRPSRTSSTERGLPRWVFWLVVIGVAGRHISAVIENQSHDYLVFLASLLCITALGKNDNRTAGAMAGIGAACKATPALFALPLLWQRRFRSLVFLGVAGSLLTMLPDLVFPSNEGGTWLSHWMNTMVKDVRIGEPADSAGVWAAWNMLNQNLAGTLYRLFTPVDVETQYRFDVSLFALSTSSLKVLTTALQLSIIGAIVWFCRPSVKGLNSEGRSLVSFGEGAMVLCGMVLLSPMSSKAHFCVLLVPIAFTVAYVLYRRRDRVLISLLTAMFVSGTLTSKGILGRQLGRKVLAYGSVTLCTLCAFVATAIVLAQLRAEFGSQENES